MLYPAETDQVQIEHLAWRGVLLSALSSIRSDSLGQLLELINQHVLETLVKDLVGKRHLSEQKLGDIASIARSTIAKQRAKIHHSEAQSEVEHDETSIFDLLTKGNSNG